MIGRQVYFPQTRSAVGLAGGNAQFDGWSCRAPQRTFCIFHIMMRLINENYQIRRHCYGENISSREFYIFLLDYKQSWLIKHQPVGHTQRVTIKQSNFYITRNQRSPRVWIAFIVFVIIILIEESQETKQMPIKTGILAIWDRNHDMKNVMKIHYTKRHITCMITYSEISMV